MDFLAYVWQLTAGAILLAFAISIYIDGIGYVMLHLLGLSGIGAYGYAILTTQYAWHPWSAFFACLASGAVAGWLCAESARSLRGDMLTLVSFGLGVGLVEIYRYLDVTGSVFGIGNIPPLFPAHPVLGAAILVTGAGLLVAYWRRSAGAAMARSIRDDEWAAASLGVSIVLHQRFTGIFSGGMAAISGLYLAATIGFIEPRDFMPVGLLVPLAAVIAAAGRGPLIVALNVALILFFIHGMRLFSGDPVLSGPVSQILIALGLASALILFRLRATAHSAETRE
uniref:ABC-type branched-chain amino acid transport system, permease component n=1 Tax=Candidatus Kentrum sp. TC TaxID=2126339 RepID=A0A451A1M1_9GAMM|nr:MAG: ABC-type branched-chain amino acid transport system, permease component [Candidatus Kentron sp. TC]